MGTGMGSSVLAWVMFTSARDQFVHKFKEFGLSRAFSLKGTLSAFYFVQLANKNMKGFLGGRKNDIEVSFSHSSIIQLQHKTKFGFFRFWFYLMSKVMLFVPSLGSICKTYPSCM